jgi:hypothetical protein
MGMTGDNQLDYIRNELVRHLFDSVSSGMERCLAPGMNCKKPAIRAHSVQNSNVIDLLEENGHVKGLSMRMDKDQGPILSIGDVGRNKATTFMGLCSEHDNEIFNPIESCPLNIEDHEHLFLCAYRAVLKELHAVMEAAVRLQSTYIKRVDLGIDSGEEPGAAGLLATQRMIISYETYLYKEHFDKMLVSKNFHGLNHDTIITRHEQPTLAVCSLFSLDGLDNGEDCVRVALNVLPMNKQETLVLFSYLPKDSELARFSLAPIINSTGHYQKYLLSKLILNSCENFILSPSHYTSWSAQKEKTILEYFKHTILKSDHTIENADLFLF